jgi:hypothetical protein
MHRRWVGLGLATLGVVLIVLSFALAQQHCSSPTSNGTGPPPPEAACAAYYWTTTPLSLLGGGIALLLLGAGLALVPVSKQSTRKEAGL